MPIPAFHLAFPVSDLEASRRFYVELLGCEVGRESGRWIDFNFFGHQITAHLIDGELVHGPSNQVDGKAVPVRHFGMVLPWTEWQAMASRLEDSEVDFLIAPHVRFEGLAGEQATLFIQDPSGNGLEFKSFRDPAMVFSREKA